MTLFAYSRGRLPWESPPADRDRIVDSWLVDSHPIIRDFVVQSRGGLAPGHGFDYDTWATKFYESWISEVLQKLEQEKEEGQEKEQRPE